MVPPAPRRWHRWEDVADLFTGRPDPEWRHDWDVLDPAIDNPWEAAR